MARGRTTESGQGGKAPSLRQQRVGEEIRHALSELLRRDSLRDPALAGVSITVTEVSVSPDLKNASCYVMPLGGEDLPPVLEALGRAASFLRGQLAKQVRLRHIPNLRFHTDESFETASKIDQLFRHPAVARDLQGDDDGDYQGQTDDTPAAGS
jgi:ribosome-binding factor A